MKFYEDLVFDDITIKKSKQIKNKIINKKKINNIFLITLPANDNNMLDIITANFSKLISWRELYIIGIASSKNEAVKVSCQIIMNVYNSTGKFDLKSFYSNFE